jgi:hypothetical protein
MQFKLHAKKEKKKTANATSKNKRQKERIKRCSNFDVGVLNFTTSPAPPSK